MRLLLLGGTTFLGRTLAERALERGHSVTTYTRGRKPSPGPGVESLVGDRLEGHAPLRGREWDAVVDTSGQVPRAVRDAAVTLRDSVGHYAFVSTVNVYPSFPRPGMDEDAPLVATDGVTGETVSNETYGPMKALCERAVLDTLLGRSLVVRPGLIVGRHDATDRFTWWPVRIARGGDVLAPGRPETRVQVIDARDLADFLLDTAERRLPGIFNAVGPAEPLTLGQVLATCLDVTRSGAVLRWVDEPALLAAGVTPWVELPLWIPSSDPDHAGFASLSARRAIDAGLRFRPLADTIRDLLAWHATLPPDRPWRAGLPPDRESAILRTLPD